MEVRATMNAAEAKKVRHCLNDVFCICEVNAGEETQEKGEEEAQA